MVLPFSSEKKLACCCCCASCFTPCALGCLLVLGSTTLFPLRMIPATQRPDGTWRKARKIRAAGPTRYIPPALRKLDGGGEIGLADDCARSLGDVASVGRRGASRFLDAALFLLTTTAASSAVTTETSKSITGTSKAIAETASATIDASSAIIESTSTEGQAREHGEERRRRDIRGSDDDHPALPQRLARSVVRAAKEQLGCDDCRPLSQEPAPHRTDSDENNTSKSDGGEGSRGGSSSAGHGTWWAKLRLAEQGWAEEIGGGPTSAVGHRTGDSWVGIELSLRPCDVGYADGQTAIVEFLKGRVDERWYHEAVTDPPAEAQRETHLEEGGTEVAMAAVAVEKAVGGRGEEPCSSPDGGGGGSGSGGGSGRKGNGCDGIDEPETRNDDGAHAEDRRRGRAGGAATATITKVLIAVLIFGNELSKRDRAELHGHAEKAGGVASSSLGVGPGRFLTLTCGLGGIGAAVELKLSADKADLARSLFRLAQQQYHSRYECLSHREIREIVALGGPNAKDHPDLFKLVQEGHKIDTAQTKRIGEIDGAGPPGTPEGGNNAKGKRQQSAAT